MLYLESKFKWIYWQFKNQIEYEELPNYKNDLTWPVKYYK